ncbi:putative urea ABC transporter substrate-binding protein [Minwuia thermotolerans]|uniref:Lipid kinase n=1 Tax=Minwuia thermotolerans TaxID=2056226 RepID=A0A2M9G3R9_9PROT|nr:putative urea ABC transporter substrate-binding protein [Minwuia thermotolerans]PJK30353.1 lipid kinase [Minwuia thermotolerans]
MKRIIATIAATAVIAIGLGGPAQAEKKDSFRVAWSIYVGWMPWGYMEDSGIMDKWAARYGIDVEIVQINDYIESINQYSAGAFDGVSATNMDTLSIPAGGGVDTTALIVGDFSNGNDAVLVKGDRAFADLKGEQVNLVELSVSHYLLARGLESAGMSEADIGIVNTSDADMVAAFATPGVTAAVTWNPLVFTIMEMPGVSKIYDSADIPGEIIDLMVVNTETLADNPDFGKALAGAWYETMSLMAADTEAGKAARTAMAEASGTDLAGYDAQLATTKMFYDPADAVAFTEDPKLLQTMDFVRNFLFDHGILGEGARSVDDIGMAFPGGATLGDTNNIKFRFDPAYMVMAAEGKL